MLKLQPQQKISTKADESEEAQLNSNLDDTKGLSSRKNNQSHWIKTSCSQSV